MRTCQVPQLCSNLTSALYSGGYQRLEAGHLGWQQGQAGISVRGQRFLV